MLSARATRSSSKGDIGHAVVAVDGHDDDKLARATNTQATGALAAAMVGPTLLAAPYAFGH
eukprot:CAMPEP_0203825380 /NCGR_PEP_ID=MMETSP0115-20131106/54097_1 /ASSEMBLY_ACC=CAM_ASM_000227 /TAXON_ID=33651 /ORGANISM="Bicosoecid sp, Strain ms1" /LENGTH=60 /DNA_ID=CAMNT_0050734425 /DNA_START=107 /DNA_END=286 /DNA_ORIENTATION=+